MGKEMKSIVRERKSFLVGRGGSLKVYGIKEERELDGFWGGGVGKNYINIILVVSIWIKICIYLGKLYSFFVL